MSTIEQHRNHQEFRRNFLPQDLDLGNWDQISRYFEDLKSRTLDTTDAVHEFLHDLSELQAALSEEYSARYISMTCHTDNPELEKAYLDFLENILPRTEPEYFELSKKYLAAPGRKGLEKDRYFVLDRAKENEVGLFREENVPLQTEDEKLAQQYQKISGEMTVEFDGREQTLPQMARYQEETDRDKRRAAWLASVQRQLQDRERIESLFDQMIELRTRMARNAGFENYLEYQFQRLGRFDYGIQDCRDFHDTVERLVVPLRRALREKRRKELGLDVLKPYDLEVDPQGRQPIRPFAAADELAAGTDRIFSAVDPSFSTDFDVLRTRGLLDLDSRKGKAPGGYQSTLDEARLPFIFMNAAGVNRDVFTLLHEGGHAFHALGSRHENLYAYRQPPIEFCEVASMGMEMMACEKLDAFYTPEDAIRARERHLQDVIILLPWVARVDAFQHWIYSNPNHTRADREQQWLDLDRRFGDEIDWSDLPEWQRAMWIRQLHFFCVPLYYVEYGIAQLGALQLWVNYLKVPQRAVRDYRHALSLGYSQPLPKLFEAAGLRFAFDNKTIQPLMQNLQEALALNAS